MGSLPYVPPEQLSGDWDAVDERSDVYALGATLYEMLGLRTAFQGRGTAQLLRRIAEGRVVPLRRLNPAVPRDVQAVCEKAMERDPRRRYASAAALANDLGNVLALRPVEARRAGPGLRLARWVRRHPWRAAALLLTFVVVVGGPLGFAFQRAAALERLQVEQELARRHLDQARAAMERLQGLLGDPDLGLVPPMDRRRRELLEEIVAFYRGYLRESDDPEVRYANARAHLDMAHTFALLRDQPAAEAALGEARRVLEPLALAGGPDGGAHARGLAEAHGLHGWLLGHAGRWAEAEGHLQEALATLAALGPGEHRGPALLRARLQLDLGRVQAERGRPGRARQTLDEALEWLPDGAGSGERGLRARALYFLGRVQLDGWEWVAAEASLLEALDLARVLADERPGHLAAEALLPAVHHRLGVLYSANLRHAEALDAFRAALDGHAALARHFPHYPDLDVLQAGYWSNLGQTLLELGRIDEALAAVERSRALVLPLVGEPGAADGWSGALAAIANLAGATLLRAGRPGEALERHREAVQLLKGSPGGRSRLELARTRFQGSEILAALGRWDEAEAALRLGAEEAAALADGEPEVLEYAYEAARLGRLLGALLGDGGRRAAAEEELRAAQRRLDALLESRPGELRLRMERAFLLHDRANLAIDAGEWGTAAARLEEALSDLELALGLGGAGEEARPLLGRFALDRAAVALQAGEHAEAARWSLTSVERGPASAEAALGAAVHLAWCLVLLEGEGALDAGEPQELRASYRQDALAQLERAVALGWGDAEHLRSMPAWEELRGTPDFQRILAAVEER